MCGFLKRARESLGKDGQSFAGRLESDECDEDEFESEGSSQTEVIISFFTLEWNQLNAKLYALAEIALTFP